MLGKREWGGRWQVVPGIEQDKPSPAPREREERNPGIRANTIKWVSQPWQGSREQWGWPWVGAGKGVACYFQPITQQDASLICKMGLVPCAQRC